MTARPDMPCTPWATIDDVSGKCMEIAQSDPDVLEKAIEMAQATAFRLTFGIFTGVCTTTLRPRKRTCGCTDGWLDLSRQYSWDVPASFPYRVMSDGADIYNVSCFDCFGNDVTCGTTDCLTLPFYPVTAISNITIDGVALDSSLYEIRDQIKVCRKDGEKFPTCQDLDVTLGQAGSWSVTFSHGVAPPVDLVEHMLDYACQLAKRKLDRPCELPKRINIDRDFVSLDPMTFVKDGLTGWAPLDACIRSINPSGARRGSRMINPVNRRSPGSIQTP